jgi:hypothetical protein
MQVFEVCKPLARLHNGEMDVDVSVRLLRFANHIHQLRDCGVNLGILSILKQVASSFDPLGYIRVPEEVIWHGPDIGGIRVAGMPFQLKRVITAGALQHVELMLEGGGPDHLTTTSPERKGREGGMEERFLRVCHLGGRKHEELDKQGVGAGPNSGLDYGNETTFVQYVMTVKIDRFMQCRPGLI